MSNYKNDNVNFDLLGSSVNFFGDLGDKYFADLAAHSAQNGMLYELMKYFLKPESIFLDVGANIGVTSRAARIVCPQSKIYCLEPSPKAYHYLSKNADPDWIILNCGAGSQEAVVDFHESDFLAGSSIWLGKDNSNNEKRLIKVPIKTLDSILAENHVDNDCPLLVKVDIEGFELDALEGAKKIAAKKMYYLLLNLILTPLQPTEKIVRLYFLKTYLHYMVSFTVFGMASGCALKRKTKCVIFSTKIW
jgi:FkbM family methyltransferase